MLNGRRRARGVGLLDSMIALAILAFGLLGMTRMQSNLVRQATDSQVRVAASQLADELLSTALVDLANAACYTRPAAGACGSDAAKQRAADWQTRAVAALPGSATATSELVGDRLTVTLNWTDKAGQEPRRLEAITDVRP